MKLFLHPELYKSSTKHIAMTTNDYASTRLRHLKGSDFEVADGQPDIRGWDVKDTNDQTIGEVDDLIFDERTLRVRYMVVDLDHGFFNLKKDRSVLVPIGAGEVPEKHHEVIIPNLSAATADRWSSLPVYDQDKLITPEDEYRVRNVFTGAAIPAAIVADNTVREPLTDSDTVE